jgi:hypothetical protein
MGYSMPNSSVIRVFTSGLLFLKGHYTRGMNTGCLLHSLTIAGPRRRSRLDIGSRKRALEIFRGTLPPQRSVRRESCLSGKRGSFPAAKRGRAGSKNVQRAEGSMSRHDRGSPGEIGICPYLLWRYRPMVMISASFVPSYSSRILASRYHFWTGYSSMYPYPPWSSTA